MGWNIHKATLVAVEKLVLDIEKHLPVTPSRREVRVLLFWNDT